MICTPAFRCLFATRLKRRLAQNNPEIRAALANSQASNFDVKAARKRAICRISVWITFMESTHRSIRPTQQKMVGNSTIWVRPGLLR